MIELCTMWFQLKSCQDFYSDILSDLKMNTLMVHFIYLFTLHVLLGVGDPLSCIDFS